MAAVVYMTAGTCMLKSSLAPCFIHTLQIKVKDSLFSENNISVLIANVLQTVRLFNHSTTACEKLKKYLSLFRLIRFNAKSLATCARY